MTCDFVIRRAQLRNRTRLLDIGIANGRIVASRQEIDAGGRLVTEPFVDCHFHIDKSFSGTSLGRFDYPLKSLPRT